jgi:hypothetical protein
MTVKTMEFGLPRRRTFRPTYSSNSDLHHLNQTPESSLLD